MDKELSRHFEARAAILKALAHPTRLFMVESLSRKEYCVADLAHMVGADISTISKHLAILKKHGLLAERKQGLKVYHRLSAPCVLDFFSCLESVMAGTIQPLREIAPKK